MKEEERIKDGRTGEEKVEDKRTGQERIGEEKKKLSSKSS